MALDIPLFHRAGDALSLTWSISDYPATAGWVARLTLINSGARYQASAVASGADHLLTVTSATTAAWAAGTYTAQVDVTLAAVRHTVASGTLQVLPDLAAASAGYDTRSPARQALEAAEVALATHGARAYLQSIEMGDRKQTFTSPGEFLGFISRLRSQVQAEDNAERMRQGLQPRNKLLVRFTGR